MVRCKCSRRYTYPQFCKLQMLSNVTDAAGHVIHTKACATCGRDVIGYVHDFHRGEPRYINCLWADADYQREEAAKHASDLCSECDQDATDCTEKAPR